MKKLLAILLLAASSLLGQSITGDGTQGDPWTLYTAAHWDSVSVLGVGADTYYELANDIDWSSYGVWNTPIQNFQGQFDGNDYTMSNLNLGYSGITTRYTGLFEDFGTGVSGDTMLIKNLHLNNIKLDFDTVGGTTNNYIGAVIAHSNAIKQSLLNISVTNFQDTVFILNSEFVYWGAIGGRVYFSGTGGAGRYRFQELVVDSITFVMTNAGAGQQKVGGMFGSFTGTTGHYFDLYYSSAKNVYIEVPNLASSIGGLIGYSSKQLVVSDCYVRNIRILDTETTNTASHHIQGIVIGNISINPDIVFRTYAQGGGLNLTQSLDSLDAGFAGSVFNVAAIDTSCSWISDSTHINDNDKDFANPSPWITTGGSLQRTDEQMKDSSYHSAKGWDFVSIWGINTSYNDGYPYLLLEAPVLAIPILNNPDSSGIFYTEDDSVLVHWTIPADTTLYSFQILEYSIDGSNWTLIDTLVNLSDSSYTWVIPDDPTTTGYVKITNDVASDSSSNTFTILTSSLLNIIYPIEKTGVSVFPSDTLHINIESQFVLNIWLYWSNDSTNWSFVDSMAVDTINGQWLDTTNYVWTFDGTQSGPEIWIKAEEQADTNLYVFEENYIEQGRGYPFAAPFICQTHNQIGFIEMNVLYDPSCGWTQPDHEYFLGALDDLAETRIWTSNICEHPYTGPECDYPALAHMWLVTGSDTVELAPDQFYGAPAATVTYQGRYYYVSNDTLWHNDLINGINSIFVSDLTPLYGTSAWTAGNELLQVYQVQYSKIISDTVTSTDDFESLNDIDFEPKILIGVSTYPQSTVSLDALGYPANADPASDTQKILTGSSFTRFFFRGIHPKIDKDR